MNVGEIERRIAEIEASVGDAEAAHGLEDALYKDVLRAIANGAAKPRTLAEQALMASDLKFARWFA